METEIDALRRAAPSWSLADDQRLLDALEKMHDTLVAKCNDTSGQLTTMCDALTDASLSLDNVNNRFMSLSNSQFVERRVYDDDADVTAPVDDVIKKKTIKQPQETAESAAENMKRALQVLESMHESVVILADSDSDSGSEGDDSIERVVLKPKDVYKDRPLPHIIGSKAWKSKWHAGVLPDSASESEDSDASRHFDHSSDNERYSPESDVKPSLQPPMKDRISTSSSEVTSERDSAAAACVPRTLPAMSPADIAAELAKRLQGPQPTHQPPQPAMEESPPPQVPRKLYKPEKPSQGTIFSDEPPPIDSSDSDDDIFAELRKNKPYIGRDKAQSSVVKDLFGVRATGDIDSGSEEDGDIFSDLVAGANKSTSVPVKSSASASTKKPLPRNTEPSLPVASTTEPQNEQPRVKKPVGGISMFGGGQHSAIGAAILQRQRQASSDDTDESDVISAPKQAAKKPEKRKENVNEKDKISAPKQPEIIPQSRDRSINEKEKTQKDISEDLFAQSAKVNAKKKIVKEPIVKETVVEKKEKKVDLFSDNIFDDIDDIFNIVSKVPAKETATKKSEKTSIFDDDDDLFKDIAVAPTTAKQDKVTVENKTVTKEKTASIFDSDDDLFNDKPLQKREQKTNNFINTGIKAEGINDNTTSISENKISKISKNTKSIFDSDEDLFVENKPNKNPTEVADDIKTTKRKDSKSIFDDSDDDIFSERIAVKSKEVTLKDETGANSKTTSVHNVITNKSMLEDTDDLFKDRLDKSKTERFDTRYKDILKVDDVLFKTPLETEITERITKSNKIIMQSGEEVMKKPKFFENKSQVANEQSDEDNLQSDDSNNKQSESSKGPNNIDALNEVRSHESDTRNIKSIFEVDDDLFKTPLKTEFTENVADSKEKPMESDEEVMKRPKLIENKPQVPKKQSDDMLQSDGNVNTDSEYSKPQNDIDSLNESRSLKSVTRDIKETESLPEIPQENTHDEVYKYNINNILNSEVTKSRANVQLDDDKETFKTVSATDKKELEVTPKHVKPEISRKPTLKTKHEKSIYDDSDDDVFLERKTVKSKEITLKEETVAKSQIASVAKAIADKSLFGDTDDLFIDKPENVKTEPFDTQYEDIFKVDDNLFKTPRKTEITENISETKEKFRESEGKVVEKPNSPENNPQIAEKQSDADILQPDDNDNKESESSKFQNNIDALSESRSLKLDTRDTKETETLPEIPHESSRDKVNTYNKNFIFDSEVKKNRMIVQLDDDEDIFKTVNARDKDILAVTPKKVKPEISRKPSLKTNREKSTSDNNKDNLSSECEQVDNAKIDGDNRENITSDRINDTPSTTTSDSKLNKPSIFSEILNDQPPLFEKPKEPKRSKNVNALFDDDSDDEALFYRKSDATLDDVPSVEKKDSLSDDRFQLFFDEPPAIGEDFEQSTNKKNNESTLDFSDLFEGVRATKSNVGIIETSQPVKQVSDKTDGKNIENVIKVASNIFDEDLEFMSKDTKTNESNDELFHPKPKSVKAEQTNIKTEDYHEQTTATKKVGKLKPMNLNINVNSLLPGASPRKIVKTQEQTDGQTISINSTEGLNVSAGDKEMQPSMVKSVSFDGDPDSTILDNKLSKERAKIKVKRRPSSRRARHEAARISGIDFGQDSVDNSNSLEGILKNTDVSDTSHTITDSKEENSDSLTCDSLAEHSNVEVGEVIKKVKVADEKRNNLLNNKSEDNKYKVNIDPVIKDSLLNPEPVPQILPSKNVKSKVVYVLNDEDIFNDAKLPKSSEVVTKPKTLNILDDDDDIFKSITPAIKEDNAETKTEVPTIKTLGSVYKIQTVDSDDDIFKDKQNVKKATKPKEIKKDLQRIEVKIAEVKPKQDKGKAKARKSIFDDLSDEENELFNTKPKLTIPEKNPNKNVLFDSDSDSELFSGKSKKEKSYTGAVEKKEMKRVEVKGSLFGDDDDDDLFGAKSQTLSSLTTSSSSSRNESKAQHQSSSSDPLSVLLDPK